MKITVINKNDAQYAGEILKSHYENHLIPAEKKSYLADLKNSIGPFMGMKTAHEDETHYMYDAASQIATLGLGFNPSVFFGTTQLQEAWTNEQSCEVNKLIEAYQSFFKRKLDWHDVHLKILNSGAEANETALGHCYRHRVYPEANKVLAFEGSFHGRMMITLSATWNKSKREPFEWDEYKAEYCKYPELPTDEIHQICPNNWRDIWDDANATHFEIPVEWKKDPVCQIEINSLLEVREKLLTKKIFAILIEPMQCEGGECYSSDRFHTALLIMARSFHVPVIYDEVQTGFHLGREFFWHRQFELFDQFNQRLYPDFVVCAKKAQVGLLLSHENYQHEFENNEFSVASLMRGYLHAISLDQYQKKIIEMEKKVRPRLEKLVKAHKDFLSRPRACGLSFGFEVKEAALANKFIEKRFDHGLLYYPAGDKTLRFRLNTVTKAEELDFLFAELDKLSQQLFYQKEVQLPLDLKVKQESALELYQWHEWLLELKIAKARGSKLNTAHVLERLQHYFELTEEAELITIGQHNFKQYRQAIINLQKEVYEPARQTDITKFEETVSHKNSIGLGILKSNKLVAIAFAGPLKIYPFERGVRADKHFHNENVLYMLDVTVSNALQGHHIGRDIKYALYALASSMGVERLHGRNRDRLARAMININLSLGSFEHQYIREDYPDHEMHRDVFYYTGKTQWHQGPVRLSTGVTAPLSGYMPSSEFIQRNMPSMINKICLSNFVSEGFIKGLKNYFTLLPENLRHGYTTSGQSEAVDKIAKTIWFKGGEVFKTNKRYHMLTFKGHFFGSGSNLSRSLSFQDDPYFPVTHFDHPTKENAEELLQEIKKELKSGSYLGVWIEPLPQKILQRVPESFLKDLKKLCHEHQAALIYNESASMNYRYNHNYPFVANMSDLSPDAGMIFMGGQAGLVFLEEKHFLAQPLMLISTWDGDEFSFAQGFYASELIKQDVQSYHDTVKRFDEKMRQEIGHFKVDEFQIENGVGFIRGALPKRLAKLFTYENGRYLILPSFLQMKRFVEESEF